MYKVLENRFSNFKELQVENISLRKRVEKLTSQLETERSQQAELIIALEAANSNSGARGFKTSNEYEFDDNDELGLAFDAFMSQDDEDHDRTRRFLLG